MQKIAIDQNVIFALSAGFVLAGMTDRNSQLARHSTPLFASRAAHGVGAITGTILVLIISAGGKGKTASIQKQRWPLWVYLGGLPGAFTVFLAAVTVNSALGLAGTLAMLLVGQISFGVVVDCFGLFRLERRQPKCRETMGFALVLIGSIVIVGARS
jgi:transporter family-2 protein